jgi:hypothetical protein
LRGGVALYHQPGAGIPNHNVFSLALFSALVTRDQTFAIFVLLFNLGLSNYFYYMERTKEFILLKNTSSSSLVYVIFGHNFHLLMYHEISIGISAMFVQE